MVALVDKIRGFKVLFTTLLVFIIVFISSAVSAQGGDSQPPLISFSSINIVPQSASVGDTITFSATVTDNLSGVGQVEILYRSPSGYRDIRFTGFYDEDGILSVNFSDTKTVTTNDENGVWTIEWIYLNDRVGNSKSYNRSDISNPSQYDITINNAGGGDSQPPQVNFGSINITPQTASVGDTITFSATVTDNLSGVEQVEVLYRSPGGYRDMRFLGFYDEDGLLNIDFSDAKTINSLYEDGVWTLEWIYVSDRIGNYRYYNRNDISNPGQYDIVISNVGGGDSQPPQVNFGSINITPQIASVGDTITFTATVSDNLSGVEQVEVLYRSPGGQRFFKFIKNYSEPDLLSVNFSDTNTINSFDEEGIWTLEWIYVSDQVGNYRFYNLEDISNPSQYNFVVSNTFGPEEGNVNPENGSATVNFPNSDVTITIQTDEAGTITVTRYPSSPNSPPSGLTPASIYLNIEPSANLQGKPATIVIGYSLPLPDGVEESSLKLYRWSGSEWALLPNQTLDTAAKTITVQVDGFSTFGVFGGSSSSSSSFKKIVNRYLNIVNYSGQIEHEHTFSFAGGLAGMIATGKGDLGGVHSGTEVESMQRRSVTSTEYYNLKTHVDALPGDYLRVVSGTSNHNNHSSQLGVEAKPGEVAVINEDIATGSDRGGSYFGYRGYLYSSEGRNRMEVGSYGASVSFDVEGTSEVYVSITNQDGSTSAGWWGIE